MGMRLVYLLVAAILVARPAVAQSPGSSPSEATASPAQDARSPDLPVSLEHIREALKKPVDSSLLRDARLPSDFRIQIVEQKKIDEMMSKLDFKSGPAPAGGLYGYEQHQRLFKATDRPLMQPYAAYNAGQFFTVAIENLIGRYLGGPAIDAVSGAMRSRAEREAKAEVDQAIADYCATRTDRADIQLCSTPDR
jgi:hypothetical protein